MLNLIDVLHIFELRLFNNERGTKGLVDGDEDVAVNRSGDREASMLPVIGWEIGAPPAETDSQRTPCDDHRAGLTDNPTVLTRAEAQPAKPKAAPASDKCPHSGQCVLAGVIHKSYAKLLSRVEC